MFAGQGIDSIESIDLLPTGGTWSLIRIESDTGFKHRICPAVTQINRKEILIMGGGSFANTPLALNNNCFILHIPTLKLRKVDHDLSIAQANGHQ